LSSIFRRTVFQTLFRLGSTAQQLEAKQPKERANGAYKSHQQFSERQRTFPTSDWSGDQFLSAEENVRRNDRWPDSRRARQSASRIGALLQSTVVASRLRDRATCVHTAPAARPVFADIKKG
jgi:hypothetical protein